jgi:hypothetical protein
MYAIVFEIVFVIVYVGLVVYRGGSNRIPGPA